MLRYAIRRLLQMIPVVIGVSFIIYFIMDLAPGDIVDIEAAEEGLTQEQMEQRREEYGLNDPVVIRYARYMFNFIQGDLGKSYNTNKPVLQEFMAKLPSTMKLAAASALVSVLLSLSLGIYGALHRGSIGDNIAMVLSFVGLAIPNFWLGLMLIILFALKLGWLPSGGANQATSIILPAITVGTGLTASLARTTRSSMLDVLGADYLRTERAKGTPERSVVLKYALRNALIPIITIAGGQFAGALGGSVLTESVFSWPGVGRLITEGVSSRDVPMVTGGIILKTIIIGLILLAIDLLYALVDPRIKARYAKGGKKRK